MQVAILLWCVLAPLLIGSGACFLFHRLSTPDATLSTPNATGNAAANHYSSFLLTLLVPLVWTLAVSVALWQRQQIGWWPEEAWQQVVLPIGIVGALIAAGSVKASRMRDVQWLLAGIGVLVLAMTAMPSGEAWSDLLPLHRSWMMWLGIASLTNAYALQRMAESSAERWVTLVALAGLAGPAILAGTAYGGLAEWFLAACSATLCFAFFSAVWPGYRMWTAVFPATLFAAAGTASGRFYTFEEHPVWLYGLILFTPALIAAIDYPAKKLPTLLRLAIAAIVAVSFLSVIGWFLFSGQESQW
jgi:hypothetical protein